MVPAVVPSVLSGYAALDDRRGPGSRVQTLMDAGYAAWQAGEPAYTVALLTEAYSRIETIYSNDPAAIEARSVFTADETKDFKGEAHERAMVGYYLGLGYMRLGDLENARAAFRWGEMQDTMSAASENYNEDMAALQYLAAWSLKCMGGRDNTAHEEFARARLMRPAIMAPGPSDRVLVIVESGSAPVKEQSGDYGEVMTYSRGAQAVYERLEVATEGAPVALFQAEDLYFQATTRGGREVDRILAGKASFKDSVETVSDVSAGVSTAALQYSQMASSVGNSQDAMNALGIGMLSGLVSVGADAVSAEVQPGADVRSWSGLPDSIYLTSLDAKSADTTRLRLVSAGSSERTENIPLVKTGNCSLAWYRDGASTAGLAGQVPAQVEPAYVPAPVPTAQPAGSVPALEEEEETNDVFVTF